LKTNAGKKPLEITKPNEQNTPDNTIKQDPQYTQVNGQTVDVSPQAIAERSGWTYLKGLASAVVVAGGVTALGGDARYVEYSLNLLTQWIEAPEGQKVQARNEFLAGMVSTLASIIAKNDLTMKLDPIYNPTNSNMPTAGYAGTMQTKFEEGKFDQINLDEGKKIEVSDDLTITEKWSSIDISGEYDCIYPEEGSTGLHYYQGGMTNTNSTLVISQNANELTLRISSIMKVPPWSSNGMTSNGYTVTGESIGQGILNESQTSINWTTTTSSSGYSMTGSYYNTQLIPARTDTRQESFILRIIGSGEIEFSSTGSDGVTRTSRWKKK
jgi:hypothetical protein